MKHKSKSAPSTSLTVAEFKGMPVADSRDVARMIGKRHDNLLRDIDGYVEIMSKSTALKIEVSKNTENSAEIKIESSDFFISSAYKDTTGRKLPCYLLTKKGCDMVANKLTGEKGVLFTAAYVTAFETMHQEIMGTTHAAPEVSLRGTASFIRVMRRIMLDAGHSPLDVEQMAVGVCRTWRIPLPEKVAHHVPDQISLWETDMLSADES